MNYLIGYLFSFFDLYTKKDIISSPVYGSSHNALCNNIYKPRIIELFDKSFFNELLMYHRFDIIKFYLETFPELKCLYKDFFTDESMRQIFLAGEIDLFKYVIQNDFFDDQLAQNRLCLFCSEYPDIDNNFEFQRFLVQSGVPKKLLKYHNKESYEKLLMEYF